MAKSNEALKEQLAKRAPLKPGKDPAATVRQMLMRMGPEIQKALPKHMDADRLARISLTVIRQTPKLLECTPVSLMAAIMQAAQLGLEPGLLGHCYIIPYKKEATFQIGYKGMIDLCRRSGDFQSIYAHEVHENDYFEYCYGLHKDLKHKPAMDERGNVIGYYACYHLKDGGYDFMFMSKSDVEVHRARYSPAWNKGFSPWATEFDEMAKKTVIKKLLKYAPVSIEIQKQIAQDETAKEELAPDMSEVPNVIDVEYSTADDDEQANDVPEEQAEPEPAHPKPAPLQTEAPPANNKKSKNNNHGTLSGMSTMSQQKKIHVEADRKGYNTSALVVEKFGAVSGSTKDLTKQQASDLISWLIEAPPAQADGQQKLGGLEREPGDDDWPPIPEEEPSF